MTLQLPATAGTGSPPCLGCQANFPFQAATENVLASLQDPNFRKVPPKALQGCLAADSYSTAAFLPREHGLTSSGLDCSLARLSLCSVSAPGQWWPLAFAIIWSSSLFTLANLISPIPCSSKLLCFPCSVSLFCYSDFSLWKRHRLIISRLSPGIWLMLSKQHIIRITVSDWAPVFLLLKAIPLTHSYDSLHKTIPTQKLLYKWRINKEKKTP